MTDFPRLDVLPAPQRALWPQLAEVSRQSFVLYGGTAVALYLRSAAEPQERYVRNVGVAGSNLVIPTIPLKAADVHSVPVCSLRAGLSRLPRPNER